MPQAAEAVDSLYRSDWGRIVATLIRLVGDFDFAEEAAQEALPPQSSSGPTTGVPDSRAPGSSRRPGTRPSTASGAGPRSRR